jgi:thymidylate synthase (FAD)
MHLIRPSVRVLEKIRGVEICRLIEYSARRCYGSVDKMTLDSYKSFLKDVIMTQVITGKGHDSVLEHGKISIEVTCDRGVSHEIVRHRLASYSQESTRYCNYSKEKYDGQITFIVPLWFYDAFQNQVDTITIKIDDTIHNWVKWQETMKIAEENYQLALKKGMLPQQARNLLPNSLKTTLVMTMNIREWRHFFKMRCSSAAHPQMQEVAYAILDILKWDKNKETGVPILFDDFDNSLYKGPWALISQKTLEEELREKNG